MTEEARKAKNAYMREWYRTHRAKANAYNKKWRGENPDKVKAIQDRYWDKRAKITEDSGLDEIIESLDTPKIEFDIPEVNFEECKVEFE